MKKLGLQWSWATRNKRRLRTPAAVVRFCIRMSFFGRLNNIYNPFIYYNYFLSAFSSSSFSLESLATSAPIASIFSWKLNSELRNPVIPARKHSSKVCTPAHCLVSCSFLFVLLNRLVRWLLRTNWIAKILRSVVLVAGDVRRNSEMFGDEIKRIGTLSRCILAISISMVDFPCIWRVLAWFNMTLLFFDVSFLSRRTSPFNLEIWRVNRSLTWFAYQSLHLEFLFL